MVSRGRVARSHSAHWCANHRDHKIARKQYAVEPRQYEGRLLHQLPNVRATLGDVYVELYLDEPKDANRVALFRHGTRVFEDISVIDELAKSPWTTKYLKELCWLSSRPAVGTYGGVVVADRRKSLSLSVIQ